MRGVGEPGLSTSASARKRRMREKLAIARANSNMSVCALEAKSDALGLLILRAIDNNDGGALRRARWVLARLLVQKVAVPITRAARIARDVLIYLHDRRCQQCEGRQFLRLESTVKACSACNGSGFSVGMPVGWDKNHETVMHEALGAMGRALRQARQELEG